MFENPPKIVLSLDVDIQFMKKVLQEIYDLEKEIIAMKIGTILCWKNGIKNVIHEIRSQCDFPLIFDGQKSGTDIPAIIKKQVKIIAEADINGIIAAPQGSGFHSLNTFINSCNEYNLIPFVVAEMTHPGCGDFLLKDASERIFEKSIKLGVTNFILPANKPDRLHFYRKIADKKNIKINIFSPGIGPQGGGPGTAINAGTDFVIVGRSIYEANNPREKVIQIYDQITQAYTNR
ncbi:MAG: orotidine 5'-phosphate decarboxylase / HUMPS family protein [Candidatus Hodarchaeota archaeon]